jgi:glutaredoxin
MLTNLVAHIFKPLLNHLKDNSMKDINCPYCDHAQDICHDDGFGYTEGVRHEIQCEVCSKNFVFETSISFYYEPQKADCLNGSEHNYQRTHTCPDVFTKMACADCDSERELTEQERKDLGIGTVEEYFEKLKNNIH